MAKEFIHFLITRFNVRQSIGDYHMLVSPVWLDKRMKLFEDFCLPSVKAQRVRSFTWLIFLDSETPSAYLSRLSLINLSPGTVELITCEKFDAKTVQAEVKARIPPGCPYVISSRLDNDDALNEHYIEGVQRVFSSQKKQAVNWLNGLVYCRGRVYKLQDRSNAFISLIESTENFETVQSRWHTHIDEVAPIMQLNDGYGWLQTVHGSNVRNVVRGCRVRSTPHSLGFRIGEDVYCQEAMDLSYIVDRCFFDFFRNFRTFAVNLVKVLLRRGRRIVSTKHSLVK